MFELLFLEPLSVWREADHVFASGWSASALFVAIAVVAVAIVVSLWRAPLSRGRRVVLGLLQLLVAAVALTMLWRPALELERTRAGENAVAWLLDTSASMDTADVDGRSRRAAVVEALLDEALLDDDRFVPRLVALGEEPAALERLDGVDDLPSPSARSGVASGLENVLADVGDTSLAAVVLLSDGADNVGGVDARWWQRLAAAGVPVHTVGVGALADDADIELADVTLPRTAEVGARVRARLRIAHGPGADGGPARNVRLRVTAGDALLLAEDLALVPGAIETVHTVAFDAGDAGLKRLDFTLDAERTEINVLNDAQSRVIDVRDAPRRILYVEGEPRWEYKFLRRAVDDLTGLEIASLLRTSPNKFYRQGVRDGRELEDGFPKAREALFAYDAVIIGSLAAAELDAAQQAALRDFVNLRGGSLLMLAGRQGLADGGWARSGVAPALPVALDARRGSITYRRERVAVQPTRQGLRTPWLRLTGASADVPADAGGGDADDAAIVEVAAEAAAWAALPEVADHQALGTPKPGARVLLESADGAPMFVAQRYGRGTSLVLGTSGTWRWQMGMPSEDESHERFWRSVLGELAARALPRLELSAGPEVIRDGEATTVTVDALGADFTPLAVPTLGARVTAPDGSTRALELVADAAVPGRYAAPLALDDDGPWAVAVTTPPEGESPVVPPATVETWVLRESGTAEAFGARQQQGFLERVASSTGGRHFPLARIDELPAALESDNAALTRSELLPLWNLPFFFLLLALGKGIEWLLRLRWRRL